MLEYKPSGPGMTRPTLQRCEIWQTHVTNFNSYILIQYLIKIEEMIVQPSYHKKIPFLKGLTKILLSNQLYHREVQ